jgi:hypothetical protein
MALESNNPIAQTFKIDSSSMQRLPGVFLTGIGVYFKSKSTTLGITCAVCECIAGVPDVSKIIAVGGRPASEVLVSDDATAETIIYFKEPAMIQTNKLYAFYVYPNNNTPDYEMWVSEIGGKDITTGQSINQQPYVGTLFVSSNGNSWNAVDTQDLKFSLYAANFPVSTGKVVFRNKKIDFCSLDTTVGIVRKTTGSTIQIGDLVYAANAQLLTQILTDDTKFPKGVVEYIDEATGELRINSNGKFTNSSVTPATANFGNIRIYRTSDHANTQLITESNRIANASIASLNDVAYNAIVPKLRINEPVGTAADYSYKGTANSTFSGGSFAKDSNFTKSYNNDLRELRDYQRVLRSYSNEVQNGTYGTRGTSTYEIDLYTGSQWISPVIDLSTKTIDYITNQINNDSTNEHTRYGNAKTKYISRTVVLDTTAEDLRVWITGYRPAGTNILVYAKFLNTQFDSELFDTKPWTPLEYINNTGVIYSSPKEYEDYKEYQFGVPAATSRPSSPVNTISYLDSTGNVSLQVQPGTLSYYNSDGALYRGFDTFSIKIVLLSDDGSNFPTMRDVRAVALQV